MRYLILALLLFTSPAYAIGPMAIPTAMKNDYITARWSPSDYEGWTAGGNWLFQSGGLTAYGVGTRTLTKTVDAGTGEFRLDVMKSSGGTCLFAYGDEPSVDCTPTAMAEWQSFSQPIVAENGVLLTITLVCTGGDITVDNAAYKAP